MRLALSSAPRLRNKLALKILFVAVLPSSLFAQGWIQIWGGQYGPGPHDAPGGTDFVQITAGGGHGLALRTDGSILGWGNDERGQVSGAPTGNDFTAVAAGGLHSLALRADGSIEAWGWDLVGQVSKTPGGTGFVQVDAGASSHSLALRTDGSIAAWGLDDQGPWDFGQVTDTPTGTGFIDIAAGNNHSAAVRADGSIAIWGRDAYGLLTNAPADAGYTQVVLGDCHALALRADGSIVWWGQDHEFGVSGTPGGFGYVKIDTNWHHAVALHSDGSIRSWGGGYDYDLVGDSPPGPGFIDIAAGNSHSVALRAANVGTAFCFGDGTGAACPCGTPGQAGAGCENAWNSGGATLYGFGNAVISADDFGVQAVGATLHDHGALFQAAGPVNGGLGTPFGNGLLCISGRAARAWGWTSASGSVSFPDFGGRRFGATCNGPGVPTLYQFWYRDYLDCGQGSFNFSNALAVTWVP